MSIDRSRGVRRVTVGDLLEKEYLSIPPYQRPYSWETETAVQLLDDIREAFRPKASPSTHNDGANRSYVLGAVILHADAETGALHVVDGQQRLLTLMMLLDILDGSPKGGAEASVPASKEDPRAPVVQVRNALTSRVRHLDEPPEQLADFIRAGCELIRVETDDPDEAFRVFDSQNYRGKALLPHDLLKAYHLREMRGETASMKAALVEGWESVPDSELDTLFSTYLWRIKRWSRGLSAPTFGTQHVDTFRGLTTRDARTPSTRYHLAAQAAVPMLSAWSGGSEEAERTAARSRFQLDAPIVAGHDFFEMVTFMLAELKSLRSEGFMEPAWQPFASTDGELRELASKARYRYVSELYLAALLYYTNKFGDSDVRQAKQRLFTWAYSLRTEYQRVQLVTVNNRARNVQDGQSAFVLLRNAESAAELRGLAIEVKEREAGHEPDLMRILTGLVG